MISYLIFFPLENCRRGGSLLSAVIMLDPPVKGLGMRPSERHDIALAPDLQDLLFSDVCIARIGTRISEFKISLKVVFIQYLHSVFSGEQLDTYESQSCMAV